MSTNSNYCFWRCLKKKLAIKTNNGKYYLDKEKLAQAKAQLDSKNTKLDVLLVCSTLRMTGWQWSVAELPVRVNAVVG